MQYISSNSCFTVYQSKTAIELRPGSDRNGLSSRVVCSCLSYDNAKRMAELSSRINKLPVVDYSRVQID
jgi:hypothetical protein